MAGPEKGLIFLRSTTHTPTKLLLQEHATSLPSSSFKLMSRTYSTIKLLPK